MQDLPFDIDINLEDNGWSAVIGEPMPVITRAVLAVWPQLIRSGITGELSIALVSDKTIQALNRDYRDIDTPTNVLSFPAAGPPSDSSHSPAPLMGDIVLARETILREAGETGKDVTDHITHLIIHGLLHLQGYDHETDDDAAIMEAMEIEALGGLGIDNPYENREAKDT